MPHEIRRTVPSGIRLVAAVAILATALAGCDDPEVSAAPEPGQAGLVALIARGEDVVLLGWDATSPDGIPIDLPGGVTVWIATGRAGVLAATRDDGTVATSDPIELGEPLDWRRVRATGPEGDESAASQAFATWDPEGGRYAALAGDLVGGGPVRMLLVDPSLRTVFEIDLGRSILAAPPAWIGDDRVVVISGDTADPSTTIVDTTTGDLADGPEGVRLLAASADGRRVATMAGRGRAIFIRDTNAWLAGDGASLGSVDPPDDTSTAIAFALDDDGQRLAIAWAADDGAVSIAVHDGAAGWRRTGSPETGLARGAVVAWRRGS